MFGWGGYDAAQGDLAEPAPVSTREEAASVASFDGVKSYCGSDVEADPASEGLRDARLRTAGRVPVNRRRPSAGGPAMQTVARRVWQGLAAGGRQLAPQRAKRPICEASE